MAGRFNAFGKRKNMSRSPLRAALDHTAFRRNRLNAENVIDSKSFERASREKPVSTLSQRALGFALMLFALFSCATALAEVAEPEGYRLDDYRAPTPATLKGAHVVDTSKAYELWRAKSAVFIDALARPPKPADLPPKTIWRDKPRADIPGSVWLVNTGFGALAEATQRYFETGLVKATGGDKTKPLVFYCLTDCWMSWNAAKRALSLGYADVYWYPEGTDGWEKGGYPLEDRAPEAGF
jgi:PQQ-dependent catabolism-associated CXXCW motif protein